MAQISDFVVHYTEEDNEVLRRKLFNVNMRLYNSNKSYNDLINRLIDYMAFILFKIKFTDYPELKGISGANVGIPFNIVLIKKEEGKGGVYINPKYRPLKKFGTKKVKSNCGSVVAKKPITVDRYEKIVVSFYNRNGEFKKKEYEGKEAYTLQHEIDHNNGILILDIATEEKDERDDKDKRSGSKTTKQAKTKTA